MSNAPSRPITYLDHSASTPLCDAARSAIAEVLQAGAGNPSSVHLPGQLARRSIDRARESVADLVGCHPDEVIFTSGATEANQLAWLAVARAVGTPPQRPWQAISCRTEHPSVLAAGVALERLGWQVQWLEVDPQGRLEHEAVEAAVGRPGGRLLSLMAINNETGVRHDVQALGALAHTAGLLYHCDATQLAGREAMDWKAWPVDLLSLSGHKLGAPAGVGALIARRGTPFEAPLSGHQEQGLRSGTENLMGIVGLGAAAAVAGPRVAAAARIRALRDQLWNGIAESIEGVQRNGDVAAPWESGHVLNVSFDDAPGDLLAMALDLEDVAVSTGSACTSGTLEPSHVLLAMGDDSESWRERCSSAIRWSFGPENGADDVARVLCILPSVVARVRARHT